MKVVISYKAFNVSLREAFLVFATSELATFLCGILGCTRLAGIFCEAFKLVIEYIFFLSPNHRIIGSMLIS